MMILSANSYYSIHLSSMLYLGINHLLRQDLYVSPSQFQDLDPHCSCQNTSSNPAVDKRHTLALEGADKNIALHCLGWISHLITIFKNQG